MPTLRFRARNLVLGLAVLVAIALLLPPLVNLGRYRRRVGEALGKSLNRPVEVGGVSLRLLPWPAVVAENVVIGELPELGLEPFAHMAELRATLRLWSLMTGHPVFSSVVFVEPSVNLSRGHLSATVPGIAPREFPYIEIRDARINFKDGDVKQVFFFSQVEGALYLDGERVRARFRGRPARTDRALSGAGELRVEGYLSPQVDLSVRVLDSFLSDLLAIPTGVDPGVQGKFNIDLRATGRLAALRFEGSAQVNDLRGRDLLPPLASPAMRVTFTGSADIPGRRLDLAGLRSEGGTIVAYGSVNESDWDFQLRLNQADASRWFTALKYFSPRLSAGSDLSVTGTAGGSVHFMRNPDGPTAEGAVTIEDCRVRAGGVTFDTASEMKVEFADSMVRLLPVRLQNVGLGDVLTVSAAFDWTTPVRGSRMIQATASGQNLALQDVSPLAAGLGWPGLPSEGSATVNARMTIERDQAPAFTGTLALQRVRWTPGWLAQPVTIHTAKLNMTPERIKVAPLVVDAGESTITGTLERGDDGWSADLRVNEMSAAGITALFSTRQPVPDAVRRLDLQGKLVATHLHLRTMVLEDLQSSFSFSGQGIALRDARAKLAQGRVTGRVDVTFPPSGPQYDVSAKLSELHPEVLLPNLAEGSFSGTIEIKTQGRNATEVADAFTMGGSITGRAVRVRSESLATALGQDRAASFGADVTVSNRRVRISRLTAGALEASGTVGFDRTLDLDFKTFKLGGTLADPQRIAP